MLTHTIRALTLLGLMVIAHTVRPISTDNVAAFVLQTAASVGSMLPAETVQSLQEYGSLAALVTGHHELFANRLTQNAPDPATAFVAPQQQTALAVKGKAVSQTAFASGAAKRPVARVTVALQARHRRPFGSVPAPFIPGLESSLMSSRRWSAQPMLMVVPTAWENTEALPRPALEIFERSWRGSEAELDPSVTEPAGWLLEPSQPKFVETPALFKSPSIAPRANRTQACSQPGRGQTRVLGGHGQSC